MEIENLLIKIADILEDLKIPYIITGGMAVSVWGRPRYTADIDIVVEMIPQNINLLAKKLLTIDKDAYISEEAMQEALKNKGEFNFIHPQSGLKVDFWVIGDNFEKQKIKRGIYKKIDNARVCFSSPEDLILSKLQWYKISPSDRHIDDIKSVLEISGKGLDKKYLRNWIRKLGLEEIIKEENISV
ncbi:MAG: hypothetical protein V1905_01595 [bacterium]